MSIGFHPPFRTSFTSSPLQYGNVRAPPEGQGFLHASAAGHPGAVMAYSIMLRSGPAVAPSSTLQCAGMGEGLGTGAGCVDNTAGWNGDEQALVADEPGSFTAAPSSHVLHASVVSVGVGA